jgi:hypothetical protein
MEQSEDILAAADEAMYSEKRRRARALDLAVEEPDSEEREPEPLTRGRD